MLLAAASPVAVSAAEASQDMNATVTLPSLASAAPVQPGNGSASGVSRSPAAETTGSLAIQGGVPLPNSRTVPPLSLFPSLGTILLDAGIDVHGAAFDHFLANPTTGLVPGNNYNLGVISPAIDFDLQRILGIPGGSIHTQVSFFGVRSNIPGIVFETGGFLTGVQTTPVASTTPIAVSLFTYEQKLLGNKLSIEAGRTNPYYYFELPNSLDPGSYFSSGFEVTADITSPRLPVWGGRTTYHFTPAFAVQGAAFMDSFFRASNHPDALGDEDASGVQTFGSLEYRTEFTTAAYPANGELGLEWNTRHGPSNIKGAAGFYNGRNAASDYHGGGVLFMQGQKVVWRGARGHFGPPPNIALYGALNVSLDKPQPFDLDSVAGVNFTGLVPRRPFDAIGLQFHYQRLSAIEANYETRVQNIFAGPGPNQQRDAYSFELVANIQALPWLSFRPFAQAFINPDAYYNNGQKSRPVNGFEYGFYGIIPIGRLRGTSTKPF